MIMSKAMDLTGKRFGRLTVIKRVENTKQNKTCWLCSCECGNTKIVVGASLINGVSQSCGCLHNEQLIKRSKKHGETNTRLYSKWQGMKLRCYYPKYEHYDYYGGRGIKICDEWINDYENFKNWTINNGYKEGLELDRIDFNGNYEPSNCRWATRLEQANNTRKNHYVEYNGETHSMAEWSRILNLSYKVLYSRIAKYNWTVEKAFTTPALKRKEMLI